MTQPMPEGWAEAAIGSLCSLINGRAFKPTDWKPRGLPIIRIQNLNNPSTLFNHYDGEVDPRVLVQSGELLFAWSGTPGTSFGAHIWSGPRAILNQHIFRVLINERHLDKRFLRFALNEKISAFIAKAHGGAGLAHITKGRFEETKLPIPPLNEQRRIVAKLEAILARSRRAKEALDAIPGLLERFRRSLLGAAFRGDLTRDWREQNPDVEPAPKLLERIRAERRRRWEEGELERMRAKGRTPKDDKWREKYVEQLTADPSQSGALGALPTGWTWALLGELGEIETGFTPPTEDASNFGGELPFIKPTDLDQGYWVRTGREHLSDKGSEMGRVVPPNSVLVTCIGATIGKTGFARVRCATNQQINAMVPSKGVEPRWLYWTLVGPHGQALIRGNASATTLPILNKGRFSSLPFPVPPAREQHEITRLLELRLNLGALTHAVQASTEQLSTLEAALIAKAFRGELVPQDPADEPASVLLERIRAERETPQKTRPRAPKRRRESNVA